MLAKLLTPPPRRTFPAEATVLREADFKNTRLLTQFVTGA